MIKNYKDLLAKVEKVTAQKELDLSSGEDLSIGIMNLIAIEEHLFYTSQKTKNKEYMNLLNEVRLMRTGLLKEIIKDYEGEVWCISKHLLAASYRLMEVGTKQLDLDNKAEAYNFFTKAYNLYSLFWGLQMKVLSVDNVKKIDESALNKSDTRSNGIVAKLGDLVRRVVNCCIE